MRPYVDENDVGDYRFIGGQPMYYADFDVPGIWYQKAAPGQSHNVSVDGSSGRTTFRMAFGYSGKEDLMPWNTTKRTRYNASVNIQTDFTDWLQMDGTSGSSDDVFQGSGAGTGFTLGDKPQVFPDGTIGGATGYLTINNGPNNGIDCKELDFIAGGAVEIEFVNKTGSNTRWVGIQGADAVLVESLEPADGHYDRAHVGTLSGTNYSAGTALGDKTGPTASLFNTWVNGFNGVDNNGTGVTKVSFRLPASFTGTKRIKLVMHKDIAITSLKIYTQTRTV
jgi:hypothetical protein